MLASLDCPLKQCLKESGGKMTAAPLPDGGWPT
jgi:hypothetical protein